MTNDNASGSGPGAAPPKDTFGQASNSTPASQQKPSARQRLAGLASHLLPQGNTEFDYIIVGGGTAGAVLADRLTENANVSVAVIEGGPSDVGQDRVLDLKRWLELMGSDLDYDYPTVEQPMGNSHIRHSRAKVLGGCSSHNTLISFRPFNEDLDHWANHYGCPEWSAARIQPYGDRLKVNAVPVQPQHRNQVAKDWVKASSLATGAPIIDDFNAQIAHRNGFDKAVGFFNISYDPHSGYRSSASVAYMHPIMPHGPYRRNNLHLFLETWARHLVYDEQSPLTVKGVAVRTKAGLLKTLTARKEVILCAGAIDTPRLLLHSEVGPRSDLEALGMPCRHDLPGVGSNLRDHPESIIMWETRDTPTVETTMQSDAGLFLRVLPPNAEPHPHAGPDLMFHIYQCVFDTNLERQGFRRPNHAICMTPNIPRSQSSGKLSLASSNPEDKPLLDFKYFEDPNGYDARILVEGMKWARKVAQQSPFKEHLLEEIAPGPSVQSDEELSAYARKVAHTVYHPMGTTKMGDPSQDRMAVVDQKDMRIVGMKGVRVCDAGVFPSVPTVNPMLTVLMCAERCADLIKGVNV
ncbi:alcohol oxidase [Jaminaea rosea]|uniref:Alcohol oxidase n=1 Tax=Jaminaea rosea TaxID=1569628 RepID=A0A316ULC6_9BASI|nr:alcohol oxidase [Jaminaea rosea]PWN24723.1 alcohol oxidase [Jaminaea rosea]